MEEESVAAHNQATEDEPNPTFSPVQVSDQFSPLCHVASDIAQPRRVEAIRYQPLPEVPRGLTRQELSFIRWEAERSADLPTPIPLEGARWIRARAFSTYIFEKWDRYFMIVKMIILLCISKYQRTKLEYYSKYKRYMNHPID
jgi:hypothetical protein